MLTSHNLLEAPLYKLTSSKFYTWEKLILNIITSSETHGQLVEWDAKPCETDQDRNFLFGDFCRVFYFVPTRLTGSPRTTSPQNAAGQQSFLEWSKFDFPFTDSNVGAILYNKKNTAE